MSYALVDAAGNTADADGRFTIGSTSGVVTVSDYGLIDFEYAQDHVITVEATGSDGSKAYSDFTIGVEDEDEPLRIDVLSRSGDTVTFGVFVDSTVFSSPMSSYSFSFSFDPSIISYAGTTNGSDISVALDFTLGKLASSDKALLMHYMPGTAVVSHTDDFGSDGVKDSFTVALANSGSPQTIDYDNDPLLMFDMDLIADADAIAFYTPDLEGYKTVDIDLDGGVEGDEQSLNGFASVQDFSEQVVGGTIVDALDGSALSDVDVYVAQTAADTNVYIRPVEFGSEMVFEVYATSDAAVSTLSFDLGGSDVIDNVSFGSSLVSDGLTGSPTMTTTTSGSMTFTMGDGSDVIGAGETVKLASFMMDMGASGSSNITLSNLIFDSASHDDVMMLIEMVSTDASGVYSTSVGNGSQAYVQADIEGTSFASDVNLFDAVSALKIYAKQYDVTNEMLIASDINRDGSVGLFDAVDILKNYAKIETTAKPGWELVGDDTLDENVAAFTVGSADYTSLFDLGEVISQQTLDLNAILVGDVNVWTS